MLPFSSGPDVSTNPSQSESDPESKPSYMTISVCLFLWVPTI